MATQTIKMVFQFRRDTAANWLANKDVVPAAGEPCFVTDENVLKIGDGVTTFENLEAIGGVSANFAADGTSIVLENDVFKLMGFDAAEVGAQPRKNAEGKLEWVVPSTETVEGLQTTVAGMQSDIETLQANVGEGNVDERIDAKINEFANKVSDNGTVDTIKELVDYVADHNGEVATMAADILALKGLVGEDPVADQIAAATQGIEPGAQVNKIETVNVGSTALEIDENKAVTVPVGAGLKGSDEVVIAEDGTLSIGAVGMSKLFSDGTEISLDGGSASGE